MGNSVGQLRCSARSHRCRAALQHLCSRSSIGSARRQKRNDSCKMGLPLSLTRRRLPSVCQLAGFMQFVAAGMQHKEDKDVSDMAAAMRAKFIPPEMVRQAAKAAIAPRTTSALGENPGNPT